MKKKPVVVLMIGDVGTFGEDPERFLQRCKDAGVELKRNVIVMSDVHISSIDINSLAKHMADRIFIPVINDISKEPRKGWKSKKDIFKQRR